MIKILVKITCIVIENYIMVKILVLIFDSAGVVKLIVGFSAENALMIVLCV